MPVTTRTEVRRSSTLYKPQSRPVLQLVLSSNAYPPKLPRLPCLGGNGILVTTHATLHATVAA
jgi:hypothetical protein